MHKTLTTISRWFSTKKSPSTGLLALFSTAQMELPEATRQQLRQRIFTRIGKVTDQQAQLLERRLRRPVRRPREFVDLLTQLAVVLRTLPKVLPHVAFSERVRQQLALPPTGFWLPQFRQVAAFVVVFILIASVALVSFVSQTPTALAEVARLDIQSGLVQIRSAEETFFATATNGVVIHVGDTIQVGSESGAELAFVDRSIVRLAAETEISIIDFQPDSATLANSQITMALVAGQVDANVAKEPTAAAFTIETSAGTVVAQSAKFSVQVAKNGTTQVVAAESTVALSTPDTAPTQLVAGETALLAAAGVEITSTNVVALAPVLPDLVTVATELDILQIRLFGALSDAQAGQIETAQKTEIAVQADLADLLTTFNVTEAVADRAATLRLVISDLTADESERAVTLHYLATIDTLEVILNHYFVAPTLRAGVPELELLRQQGYRPTASLARLYTALQAQSLAAESSQPAVWQLIQITALEYSARISASADPTVYTAELLRGMANQPIYLPALTTLRNTDLPEVAELIEQKIESLTIARANYIGG